jgi:hypothetical protein
MPGAEFEELRLQVSVTDDATAQLRTIKMALDELGTGTQAQNIERLKRHTSELDESLRKLIETVSKGPKGFLDLARNVTIAGVSLGTFGLAIDKTIQSADQLSKKLVDLLHVSQQTGLDAAKIDAITKAYERHGLSVADATREIKALADAKDDFNRRSSQVRIGIARDLAGDEQALDLTNKIVYDAVRNENDITEYYNKVKKGAADVRKALEESGREPFGRFVEQTILKRFGTPLAINVDETIEPVSDAMSAAMRNRIKSAAEYETITKSIHQNWKEITQFMTLNLMDSGLIKALNWVNELLKRWRASAEAKPTEPYSNIHRAPSTIHRRGQAPAAGAPPGGEAEHMPAPSVGQYNLLGGGVAVGGGGQGGGAGNIPAIGDLLRSRSNAITLPETQEHLAQSTTGAGWRGFPMSKNIEDRRGEALLENQNDQTRTLVGEIHRLNALLSGEEKPAGQKMGLLAMPSGVPGGVAAPMGALPTYPTSGAPADGRTTTTTPGGTRQDGTTAPPPDPRVTPSSQPGPGGQPMAPWGTTTAGFGGGAGLGAAGGVAGAAGGPSGPAAPRGGGGTPGGGGAGGDNQLTGNAYIAQSRAKLFAEYDNNPQLRKEIEGVLEHETHKNPQVAVAVMETMVNRALRTGKTLAQEVHGGFYGPVNRGEYLRDLDKETAAHATTAVTAVRHGSNVTDFRDDQGTNRRGQPEVPKGGSGVTFYKPPGARGGEHIYYSGPAAVAFAEQQRARAARAPTTAPVQTASISPQAPVSGTPQTTPPQGPPGAAGDPTVSSAILARAREVAIAGGPRAVSEFMNRMGHPKHDAWCGDFAASVIKSVGGTPPQNPAIASNWRRTPGYEETTTPQPGDIAVRRPGGGRLGPGTTGQTGSHVTFFEGYDPKTGKFIALGGNQGRIESQYDARRYQFYHPAAARLAAPPMAAPPPASTAARGPDPATSLFDKLKEQEEAHKRERVTRGFSLDEARKQLDRLSAAPKKVNGTGDITVNVKHGPRTRRMNALKKVPLSVFAQGEKASSGPPAPVAATGESHEAALDS